jgi:hypothetical protein
VQVTAVVVFAFIRLTKQGDGVTSLLYPAFLALNWLQAMSNIRNEKVMIHEISTVPLNRMAQRIPMTKGARRRSIGI